jgi:CheY-like chemotaxis protein
MTTAPQLPDRRVLVVDDDPQARSALSALLRAAGFDADTAADGREAFRYLYNHPAPCLVLLDLRMAGMDGWTFCDALRVDPHLAGIPVVICSGVADLERQASGLNAQAVYAKPVDPGALIDTIRRLC